MSSFEELYKKDLNAFVETKGSGRFQASYLTWAVAVKELKIAYPEATYQIVTYNELPYLKTETGFYVTVKLWLSRQDRIDNIFEIWTHPVLDNKFDKVDEPDNFEINTSTQRCLVKLIGIATGIGLSLYSGEDITDLNKKKEQENILEVLKSKVKEFTDIDKLATFYKEVATSIEKQSLKTFVSFVTERKNELLKLKEGEEKQPLEQPKIDLNQIGKTIPEKIIDEKPKWLEEISKCDFDGWKRIFRKYGSKPEFLGNNIFIAKCLHASFLNEFNLHQYSDCIALIMEINPQLRNDKGVVNEGLTQLFDKYKPLRKEVVNEKK